MQSMDDDVYFPLENFSGFFLRHIDVGKMRDGLRMFKISGEWNGSGLFFQ